MPVAAGFAESFTASLSKVWNFFVTGGWFMVPLIICSLILVAVVVWKVLDLKRERIIPESLAARLRDSGPLLAAGKFGTVPLLPGRDELGGSGVLVEQFLARPVL